MRAEKSRMVQSKAVNSKSDLTTEGTEYAEQKTKEDGVKMKDMELLKLVTASVSSNLFLTQNCCCSS